MGASPPGEEVGVFATWSLSPDEHWLSRSPKLMAEYEIHLVIAIISRVILMALILGIYNFQSFLPLMIGYISVQMLIKF